MDNLKQAGISAYIVTLVALVTLIGPYAADWNHTHIYNPHWPPHAKFHNAQTMLLGTVLAFGALWYTWKPVQVALIRKNNFKVALFLAAIYWITQSLSILFPETGFTDPEFGEVPKFIGIPATISFKTSLLPFSKNSLLNRMTTFLLSAIAMVIFGNVIGIFRNVYLQCF